MRMAQEGAAATPLSANPRRGAEAVRDDRISRRSPTILAVITVRAPLSTYYADTAPRMAHALPDQLPESSGTALDTIHQIASNSMFLGSRPEESTVLEALILLIEATLLSGRR